MFTRCFYLNFNWEKSDNLVEMFFFFFYVFFSIDASRLPSSFHPKKKKKPLKWEEISKNKEEQDNWKNVTITWTMYTFSNLNLAHNSLPLFIYFC